MDKIKYKWVAYAIPEEDHAAFVEEAGRRTVQKGERVSLAQVLRSESHRDANRLRAKHRAARA